MDFTSNYGVDVILDMVGGEYIQQDNYLLTMQTNFVTFLNSAIREIDFQKFYEKTDNYRINFTSKKREFKSSIADVLQREIWPLFEKKNYYLYGNPKFNDFKQAHDLMESSKHIGKWFRTSRKNLDSSEYAFYIQMI